MFFFFLKYVNYLGKNVLIWGGRFVLFDVIFLGYVFIEFMCFR